nr:hypothetical protein Iba_chr04fCG0700 [Ipomoea batatas]
MINPTSASQRIDSSLAFFSNPFLLLEKGRTVLGYRWKVGNLNKRSSHQPLPTHPYNPLSDIRNLKNRSHSRAWGPVSERADTCQVSYDDREKSTVNIFRDFRSTTVGFKGRVELIPYSRRLVQVPSSACRAIPIG